MSTTALTVAGTFAVATQHLQDSLGNLWMIAELLKRHSEELRPAKRGEYVEFIAATAADMSRVVADLVQLTSLKACSDRLDRVPLRISEVLVQSMEGLHALAESRGVEVRLTAAGTEPKVLGDYWKLSQATHILLERAIQSCAEGGRVSVDIGAVPNAVRIVFLSSGSLCAATRRAGDLGRESRDDAEDRVRFALAKELIDLHGGLVSGFSAPNQVVVVLPEDTSETGS